MRLVKRRMRVTARAMHLVSCCSVRSQLRSQSAAGDKIAIAVFGKLITKLTVQYARFTSVNHR